MRVPAGVVGFRGYSGAELVRLLRGHPHLEPILLDHRSDAEATPGPRQAALPKTLAFSTGLVRTEKLAVVFLATPPEVSMELVPQLLAAGARIVDLSGAFRLQTPERYQRWYGASHQAPDLLAEAAYGLPEFCRDRIRGARLVANPGCYPTAANLAIRPLLEAGLLDPGAPIVCDAKSGVSGAGRKPSLQTSFCEVTGNFSAYSILHHRHVPEVLLHSGLEEARFFFTAQLLPVDRGILETIYVQGSGQMDAEAAVAAYESFYGSSSFVRCYEPGSVPDLSSVLRTNFCHLGVVYDVPTRRGVVVSVIDNLVKGAAGQAVQNANLMLGFPEEAGLL